MTDAIARAVMVITPEQETKGYYATDRLGPVVERRRFEVIRRLPDGNYLVYDPTRQ